MFKFLHSWSLHDVWELFRKEKPEQALSDAATKAVNIVENVKTWVNSPSAEFFAQVLGDAEFEKDRELVTKALDVAIKDLSLLKDIKDLPNFLNTLPAFQKSSFLHNLALILTNVLSDGKFDFGDVVIAVQMIFEKLFGKKA
jgi:hypothetical protein